MSEFVLKFSSSNLIPFFVNPSATAAASSCNGGSTSFVKSVFEPVSSCKLSVNDENVLLLFNGNSAAHGSGELPRNMEDVLERGSGFSPGEFAVLLGQANGLARPDPSCLEADGGC